MKMYYLLYHVQPRPDLEDADDIGGAYVSCWIEAESIKQAVQIAKQEIGDLKWEILEEEEAYELDGKEYNADSDDFEFYQQALIDQRVLCFHTYPLEEE